MVYRQSEDYMSTIAFPGFALTCIADFARSLSRLYRPRAASRRRRRHRREFNRLHVGVGLYYCITSATIC
jgi:hypothetical protein